MKDKATPKLLHLCKNLFQLAFMQHIRYFGFMTITGLLLTMSATLDEHGHEATHVHAGDFWPEFLALATDPAHLAFEFVFSLVFDFIIVTLLYGILIQKILIPRLRKSIHEEIDKEHGVVHKEHDVERPKE